jgi:hypothetical protein
MSKLLKSGEVGKIGLEYMKKIREHTVSKWDSLGFLKGLSGHVKENIAQLYESQASSLLNESTISAATKDFETIKFPTIKVVHSKTPSGDTTENKTEDEI